jgi:predicted RNA-binding protein YlxR (DUF448 family)/ribosomal protein L30E
MEENEGTPERTCVGCGKRNPADALVRLVLNEAESTVVVDAKGGSFGRGAHVHADRACLEGAAKKGLPRAFKREMRVDVDAVLEQIGLAYDRRIEGLLSGGVRGGHIVFGTDKVVEALRMGTAKLVVLAADARTAAERNEVRQATGEGRALVLRGDRMRLAAALGRHGDAAREGVAICAVTSEPLAAEVRRAWLTAGGTGRVARDSRGAQTVENAE